jgi:hypothetical protein
MDGSLKKCSTGNSSTALRLKLAKLINKHKMNFIYPISWVKDKTIAKKQTKV